MLMSKENYKKLTDFYNYIIETADDSVAEYFINCLATACKVASDNLKKMEKHKKSDAQTMSDNVTQCKPSYIYLALLNW